MISKNKKRQFQALYCLGLLMLIISASMSFVDCGGGAGGAGGEDGSCTRTLNDAFHCEGDFVVTQWIFISEEACSEKCAPNDSCCETIFCPPGNGDCYEVYNDPGDPPDPVYTGLTTTAIPNGGTYAGRQEVELVVDNDISPFDACLLQVGPDDVIETLYWTAESDPGVFELYTTPIIITQDTELYIWSRLGACEEESTRVEYYIIECSSGNPLCDETWYKDFDHDLYGDMDASSIIQPNRPTDYYLETELTQTDTDCDDNDASINPGATDIIGDGIDQDCDGEDADTFTIPDTGQTTCYNSSGNAIDCTGTGQDGEYSINPMSFTDNSDGTVTDNVTGLMWQQEDDNTLYNWFEASGTVDATSNPSGATDVCGALTTGGHSDWRLPMKIELESIVDYGKSSPVISTTYFPGTNTSYYWLSNTQSEYVRSAWRVNFDHGTSSIADKASYVLYVRCVR